MDTKYNTEKTFDDPAVEALAGSINSSSTGMSRDYERKLAKPESFSDKLKSADRSEIPANVAIAVPFQRITYWSEILSPSMQANSTDPKNAQVFADRVQVAMTDGIAPEGITKKDRAEMLLQSIYVNYPAYQGAVDVLRQRWGLPDANAVQEKIKEFCSSAGVDISGLDLSGRSKLEKEALGEKLGAPKEAESKFNAEYCVDRIHRALYKLDGDKWVGRGNEDENAVLEEISKVTTKKEAEELRKLWNEKWGKTHNLPFWEQMEKSLGGKECTYAAAIMSGDPTMRTIGEIAYHGSGFADKSGKGGVLIAAAIRRWYEEVGQKESNPAKALEDYYNNSRLFRLNRNGEIIQVVARPEECAAIRQQGGVLNEGMVDGSKPVEGKNKFRETVEKLDSNALSWGVYFSQFAPFGMGTLNRVYWESQNTEDRPGEGGRDVVKRALDEMPGK